MKTPFFFRQLTISQLRLPGRQKLLFLTCCILICINNLRSQSELVFNNVIQSVAIQGSDHDPAQAMNFNDLSVQQLMDLRQHLNRVLQYKNHNDGYIVFCEPNEAAPLKRKTLRKILVRPNDSVEVSKFDKGGNEYIVLTAVPADSTWFYNNVAGFRFKEDWIIDTVSFTCNIKSKYYTPLVVLPGKEEVGAQGIITIKPIAAPKSLLPVTDLIVTDVYLKSDPLDENGNKYSEGNTEIDAYKVVNLINTAIDKAKAGVIGCYQPQIPFHTAMSTTELRAMLTDEPAENRNGQVQVRYQVFCYRFKLVEKWFFDPATLAFKKHALGMIVMKREAAAERSAGADGVMTYTFSPIAYIPFNTKQN